MTADRSTVDDDRHALYTGPRDTFVERRTELARAARTAGDPKAAKEIGAMRKPTAAAHLVNLLAQANNPQLHEVVELGANIRAAMAGGDDGEMRALLQSRAAALANTVTQAGKVARANGESVTAALTDQIMQTLRAAMASDDAAAAVLSGTLTDALDEPGFGGVSIDAAARAPVPKKKDPKKVSANVEIAADLAEEEAAQRATARERIKVATADVKLAEKALVSATKRHDGLEGERERLVAQLAQVDADIAAARAESDLAEATLSEAMAKLEAAGESPAG